jgi:hypothetical protein
VEGYRFMDIGDARDGGPLSRFKAQFKAEPVPDHRYDYALGGSHRISRAIAATREVEEADADGLAARAWERAPLAATRAAAALVYRLL